MGTDMLYPLFPLRTLLAFVLVFSALQGQTARCWQLLLFVSTS